MFVKNNKNKIFLTIDFEYWYESPSIWSYLTGNEKDSLSDFTHKFLNLLNKYNAKATFFVSGKVLDKEPELIKKINKAGHEIAIHTLDHKPLYKITPEKLDNDIKILKNKIFQIINKQPIGYRAPNFSLNNKTKWALKILEKNNIKYDSSIFPYQFPKIIKKIYKNSSYGVESDKFIPYKIYNNLVEFPLSVYHYGRFKLPLTGGIYIRIIPWWIYKILLKNKLKTESACLHFHPYDLQKKPDIKMPRLKKIIKYYNTKKTWKKLKYILERFECVVIKENFDNIWDKRSFQSETEQVIFSDPSLL